MNGRENEEQNSIKYAHTEDGDSLYQINMCDLNKRNMVNMNS